VFHRTRRDELDVNITPLIDVVFLLLIFFMVSTSFQRDTQIALQLPKVVEGAKASDAKITLEITIDSHGNYFLNGKALINNSAELLTRAIQKLQITDVATPVVISADAKSSYQTVITAMDVVGKQGFSNISLATETQKGQ